MRFLLLGGTALFLVPAPAGAQQAQPGDPAAQAPVDEGDEGGDSNTIVVTGAKPRGSVLGDIPADNVLTGRDVLATGATDINELLDAIAPQTGSARGRGGERPVMLLNGQRVSSFRELRDIPTEAISRVEILPEEVALKYGYSADQRVVNIVLRPRFRSTAALVRGQFATEGGYGGGVADMTRLMIGEKGRTSINLHAEGNTMLTESERDIALDREIAPGSPDPRDSRSLIGDRRDLRATATFNRELGAVAATANIELEHNDGRSLIGLGDTLLRPLARNTSSDSAHAGVVLSGNVSSWHWSVTGNADAGHDVTKTDRDATTVGDRGMTTQLSSDVEAVANGKLFRLPAGDSAATITLGASALHLDSSRVRDGVEISNSLSRRSGTGALNFDLPVSRRNSDFAALGNLSLNANAQVDQLSDFGALTTIGAGANWSPVVRLNLIGSWTREEGAPTVQQLGNPLLETPGTRLFDFTTGETVLVTAIIGGNAGLQADRRSVVKIGANWRPLAETDLTLRADYVRSRIKRPISNFPGPTPALEAAFPDRFVRNPEGELISVDLRPVNFDSSRRDTLRIGFDFSQPLKSKPPSAATLDALRARTHESGGPPITGGSAPHGPPEGGEGIAVDRGGGGHGAFRFFGGGARGGRLMFSLTDTVTLVDEVTIRPGLPKLDYLRGDALGQGGGRPRHQVEGRAGYFNNGLGAFLSANWRSGTRVKSATGDDLRFSSLATFDLRLFANLGQRFDLVARHPWLRGTSVRFQIDNVFDSKPTVRDAFGAVPSGYQPDLLDPLGRTVSITIRKLFLPPPSFFRRRAPGGGEN